MPSLERNFMAGAMNKDDDERNVSYGQYRHALNIEISSPTSGDAGSARNLPGNTKIGNLGNICGQAVDSSFECIGAVAVPAENKIYYLIASDYLDGVYEYNEISGNITRVLQSTKATPTTASQLNFDKAYYVTGFNFLDGYLFWTDNLNEPFFGKVERWKSYNIDDPRIDLDKRLIKSAPLNSPVITMETEDNEENNIEDTFIQFAYRYRYVDNQYSAFSPFSSTAFVPGSFILDYNAGNNKAMVNSKNKVNVRFETGNQFVKSIELLFRDTTNKNIRLVEKFDKDKEGIDDNNVYSFDFDNDKTFTVVTDDQLVRLWDNVPLKAKAMDVVDRRIIMGNYTQFYDITDSNGKEINIDFNVSYVSEPVEIDAGKQTFRSDRDLEIGLIYGDDDGRFTTVQTCKTNTTYIKPSNSITANSLVVDISNDPPAFATNYRIVIKQAKQGYYNIFPILYYAKGNYRYFLINESDRDKFSVGDYIIFKADGTGPTLNNEKYKILEFEAKGTNFLGGTQVSGLYFKIKVDNNEFDPGDVFTYAMTGTGANSTVGNGACNQGSRRPIIQGTEFKCVENPIFYGTSNAGDLLTVANSWQYLFNNDARIKIEIEPQTGAGFTFKYKAVGNNLTTALDPNWITGNAVVANTDIPISLGGVTLFNIRFSQATGFDAGDSWRISCRGDITTIGSQNIFGDSLGLMAVSGTTGSGPTELHGGFAILPGNSWSETTPETDRAIQAGAIIKIGVISDSNNPTQQAGLQTFTSSRRYENIEEWFFEEGIYNQYQQFDQGGNNIGAKSVYFRRGKAWSQGFSANSNVETNEVDQGTVPTAETMSYPVRMIIRGYGTNNGCDQNVVQARIELTQLEDPIFCETRPIVTDADIFHETTDTYPIVNGKHSVLWAYEDYTSSSGNTRLGQATPGDPPGTQKPHKFQVGNTINVTSSNINGTYEVIEVEDAYNVVIDLAFPGSGPVTPGTAGLSHGSGAEEIDQTVSQPARVIINHPQNPNGTYNAYTFGNGLESDRIRDDFNETKVEYSPRVVTIIDGYKQESRESSITYSGVYRGETSINKLNEFNLALGNFKDLDREFGSVQKIHARDTNIIIFQEDKVSQVLYNKSQLFDASGNSSLTSVSQVLGEQVAYSGEWGISSNPESFAEWGGEIFFTDARRGAVLKMTSGGTYDISAQGMKSYFRDLFKDAPNTRKLGVFDPYSHEYVIASNDDQSTPCSLSINATEANYSSSPGKDIEIVNDSRPDFIITSNTSWTATIEYSAGSGWVTGYPESGFGNQDVYLGVGDNNTGVVRTATITITYCGGLEVTYTINQGASPKINVITWISDNRID